MSRLGDVLELIHSSVWRFDTASVVGRSGDSTWRFWWAGNDRFRFERKREGSGFVNVRDGANWWVLDSDGRASTNEGAADYGLSMQPEMGLLHPRSLLAAAILQVGRNEQVAGRPAVVMQATPRPDAGEWRWWGFWDATEPVEIAIDLERGVALSSFHFQVDAITFDEALGAEVFSRPYDDNHPVEHGELHPLEMSLEQARRRAPFPVPVPEVLPEGARLLKCLVDPAEPTEWVGLVWAIDPGYRYRLNVRLGPAVARDAERFRGQEFIEHGLRLIVEQAEPQDSHRLFAETRAGWCEIDSDLPMEAVVTIALSIEEEPS